MWLPDARKPLSDSPGTLKVEVPRLRSHRSLAPLARNVHAFGRVTRLRNAAAGNGVATATDPWGLASINPISCHCMELSPN
jgi:hypothetical protein